MVSIFLGMSTVLFLLSRVGMNCIVSSLKAGNLCTNTTCTREYRMKICMIHFIAAVGLSEDFKLVASDGEEFDHFGRSISIDNGIVVVGADFDDGFGTGSGSVYLFEASTGTQLEKLIPKDGQAGDHFGYSVDVHSGIVAIGARLNDERASDAGAAYLFDGSTGMQLFKFVASDGGSGDWFGGSIAIDNGVVAVGATRDDDRGLQSGSVYLFDATTGAELFKLTASDGGAGDAFGHSIGIHNGIVVVEAYGNDHDGGNRVTSLVYPLRLIMRLWPSVRVGMMTLDPGPDLRIFSTLLLERSSLS